MGLSLRRRLRDFSRDTSGTIALMAGFFFLLMIGVTALAIDVGSLYFERRVLQGGADLAAIAGAGDIARAEERVEATLAANQVLADYEVVRGNYVADPDVEPDQRFTAGRLPYNAVRVNLSQPGKIFFARVFDAQQPEISVTAVAASAELASFSIGSRLASLKGGVANQLLGALVGGSVNLSVMDYRALADVDLRIAEVLQGLSTSGAVTAGTYGEVLSGSVTVGELMKVLADISAAQGDAAASVALRRLGQAAGSDISVPLSFLVDAGPFAELAIGDPAEGFDLSASALDLVSASTVLANGGRQVELNLSIAIPGLSSVKAVVAIGEPMQGTSMMAVGQRDTSVSTAQTRLRLVAQIGGKGLFSTISLKLPLYLDLAHARASLDRIACLPGGGVAVRIAARPGIADLWIGEIDTATMADFSASPLVSKADIAVLPLIRVRGIAHVEAGSVQEKILSFSRSDIGRTPGKSVSTTTILQSVVSSLLGDLDLDVRLLGLGLTEANVTAGLVNTLEGVAMPLDAVVNSLLSTLGLHLGEADIRLHAVRCDGGVLAG
ncbi:TadG family pilus assembly protein [Stappia sp. ICDLI1TA098]